VRVRRSRGSAPVLAAAVVVLTSSAIAAPIADARTPTTKPAPRVGLWKGTATDDAGTHAVSFRVVRRSGRFEIRGLVVRLQETCTAPGPPDPSNTTSFENPLRIARLKVRTTGRFAIRDAAEADSVAEGLGSFLSSRRMRGSIEGASDSLTCGGTKGTFTATAVPRT
jgi:hypothetical protein